MRFCIAITLLCVLAGLVPEAGAGPNFSHKLHLKEVGLRCTACHARAEESTIASESNVPSENACLPCHNGRLAPLVGTGFLSGREPAERTYRFNHAQHLEMGNVAPVIAEAIRTGEYLGHTDDLASRLEGAGQCQACHRGLEETGMATSANLPRMSDCLVCHGPVENPFTCPECHTGNAQLRPASHTADFLDRHTRRDFEYDEKTCEPCHGRNFACMGCH